MTVHRFRCRTAAVLMVLLTAGQVCPFGCGPDEPARAATGGQDWKDTLADMAGKITLGAEGGLLYYAFDSLADPGKPVDLVVRLMLLKKFQGIEGVTVEFDLADKHLGKAKTDKDGYARVAWTPPQAGDYKIMAAITGVSDETGKKLLELEAASLLVAARPKATKFVVIDLDHTVVASSFFRVLTFGARPMPGAAKAVTDLARTYSVIYLTHRPDLLTGKSKDWLSENGFPRAPLLVSELKDVFDSGKYKTGRIKDLRKEFPGLSIGIGDKFSDAEAYVDNGLQAYLIPHYERDTDDAKDLEKVAAQVRKLDGRIQVVDNWDEVRAGILQGKKFAPKPFADRLDSKARKLRQDRDRRRRSRRDDDDDD
jgi:hypothetical protein